MVSKIVQNGHRGNCMFYIFFFYYKILTNNWNLKLSSFVLTNVGTTTKV